jgi:hypothetical protein
VRTERQVGREKLLRENDKGRLDDEQRQRVRYLPARVVHCEGIRTDTALSIAADHGHTSVVKTLLDADADPNGNRYGMF